MTKLKIAYMGTAAFGLPALEAIVAAGHDVVCVYTRAPKPAGRGYGIRRTAIHEAAEARGIPVRTPQTLKDPAEQEVVRALDLDAAVVAAYGLILPKAVLDAPRLGCLNIHGSLLPRWRGAAPVERAILAGDEMSGVTIMRMDEGLDTGPMLLKEHCAIERMTAGELHDRLSTLGGPLIVRALDGVASGTLEPEPQAADGATYARKIEPAEAQLDWRGRGGSGGQDGGGGACGAAQGWRRWNARCGRSRRAPAPGSRTRAPASRCSPPRRCGMAGAMRRPAPFSTRAFSSAAARMRCA
jgi:methionyl-tRNA formyltransferase